MNDTKLNAVRDKYVGQQCTLDGKPAKIMGRYCAQALVGLIDPPHTGVQFSWEAIERIMAKGGNFKY